MVIGAHPASPQWGCLELTLTSSSICPMPVGRVVLQAIFRSPSGRQRTVEGFWDGDRTWRVRFSPDEIGRWSFLIACSDSGDAGLHGQSGAFDCVSQRNETRFDRHGPIRLSESRRYLTHADGTPFFWLSDTAWNGPLRATAEEWAHYLRERVRQKFTAVQWVTTQWVAAPDGDGAGARAFDGFEQISISPAFFQRLDARVQAINQAGLLAAPVLLWAAPWGPDAAINPGFSLPESQAILLARYMVARWGAYQVLWILNGDGDYRAERAERWRRIGRAVFGDGPHAPVALHPGGKMWVLDDFNGEDWLDIVGYQSGHSADEASLSWLVDGPPAMDWPRAPARPFINLEPPYENHNDMANPGTRRLDAHIVRRALYSSLLISPTAGVSYGGHGVWGWDDGTRPPVGHPKTGVPLPWQAALLMPAAEQIAHLSDLFNGIEWWRLRPAQEIVARQPGADIPSRKVVAARSEAGDLAMVYTPEGGRLELCLDGLRPGLAAHWFNPVSGARTPAQFTGNNIACEGTRDSAAFETPASGDWVLLFTYSPATARDATVQDGVKREA